MTRKFLQIWTFLRNDLSSDLKQVITNHKNKRRQMYRGRQKRGVITKINSDVFVFRLFYVLRVHSYQIVQFNIFYIERKLQQ